MTEGDAIAVGAAVAANTGEAGAVHRAVCSIRSEKVGSGRACSRSPAVTSTLGGLTDFFKDRTDDSTTGWAADLPGADWPR